MVRPVLTILGHLGPAHLPTVPWQLLIEGAFDVASRGIPELKNTLTSHTPLIKGVAFHPLNEGGGGVQKHFKTRGFAQSNPPNQGG